MASPEKRFGARTYAMQMINKRKESRITVGQDQTPELITCEPDPFVLDETTQDTDSSRMKLITINGFLESNQMDSKSNPRRYSGTRKRVSSAVVPSIPEGTLVVSEAVIGPDCKAPAKDYVISKKEVAQVREYLAANDPKYQKYEEEKIIKKRRAEKRRNELPLFTSFQETCKIRIETLKKPTIADKCNKCGEQFLSEWDVVQHISLKHSNYIDPLVRAKRSDAGQTRDYVCPTCCARVKTLQHLAKHTLEAHGKETLDPATKTPVKSNDSRKESSSTICDTCGKMTKSGQLRNHILSFHTKPEDRPYPCDFEQCDRTFVRAERLITHRRHHKNLMLFKCIQEGCEKTFVSERNMKNHFRSLHEKARFKCTICGHESKSKFGREYHVKKEHLKVKDRRCPHCDFATLTTGNLKLHIKNMHKDKLDENGQVAKEDEAKFMMYFHPDRYYAQEVPSPLASVQNSNGKEPEEPARNTRSSSKKKSQKKSKAKQEKLAANVTENGHNDSMLSHHRIDSMKPPDNSEYHQSPFDPITHVSQETQSGVATQACFNYMTPHHGRLCPMCENVVPDLTFHFQNHHRISSPDYLQALIHQQTNGATHYNNFM